MPTTTTKYGIQKAPLPPVHCGQPMRYGTHRSSASAGTEAHSYICNCGAFAWREGFGRSIDWNEPEGTAEIAQAAEKRYRENIIRDITRGETTREEHLTPTERETFEFVLSGA